MKEKFLRGIILVSSVVLFIASFAIIFWISQSEETRLALREQFTLESMSQLGKDDKNRASLEQIADTDDVGRALSEIETLLSSVGSDDLPEE
ncbi:MAG: hypothetical protein KBD27_00740 [Candidatus Moranbacteria bacterium]|nr:hypothetical protein [Candidatus Moranbacteria bacterium]